jgi:hypothetical protein
MDDLIQNPAVQAALLPFLTALVLAAALARTRWLGLPTVAGFLILAGLAIGFSFESLTATKKLVLVGAATGGAVLALEALPAARAGLGRAGFLAFLGASCVWVAWRLLAQQGPWGAVLAGLLSAGYVCVLVGSTLHVSATPVRGAAVGLMVALGTGALAVLGASAVLGLVGIAAGASCGAVLLVQMLRGQPSPSGRTVALPAVTIAGLAAILAVLGGALPWYSLMPVLAAPWAVRLIPDAGRPVWVAAIQNAALALGPMLLAVAVAWRAAAAP